jgi:hypothetical protein
MKKLLLISLFAGLLSNVCSYQMLDKKKIYGVVVGLKGKVIAQLDAKNTQVVRKGAVLSGGIKFHVGKGSEIEIIFEDGTILRAEQNTVFKIDKCIQAQAGREFYVSLSSGIIVTNTGKISSKNKIQYSLCTPTALVAVRGTIVVVGHDADKNDVSDVTVFKGKVEVTCNIDSNRKVLVGENQEVSVSSITAMEKPHALDENKKKYCKDVVRVMDDRVYDYRKGMGLREKIIERMVQEGQVLEERLKQTNTY